MTSYCQLLPRARDELSGDIVSQQLPFVLAYFIIPARAPPDFLRSIYKRFYMNKDTLLNYIVLHMILRKIGKPMTLSASDARSGFGEARNL